jgi:hypothetical protein
MTATGEADVPDPETRTGEDTGEHGLDLDEEDLTDSASDHAYFLELEDLFIGLRGAPLMLSPSDWQVAKAWRRRGIPLELVRRVLREVFEKRRQREADDIVSLRYFRRPVENAWKKARELAAGGERAEPEPFDLGGRLDRLAAALPEELPGRGGWAARIRALAEVETSERSSGTGSEPAAEWDMDAVEEALGRLDAELLDAASKTLDADASESLRRRVEEALGRLAGRLPECEIARSREHLHRRLLREQTGLPVLSLFSPAAEGD